MDSFTRSEQNPLGPNWGTDEFSPQTLTVKNPFVDSECAVCHVAPKVDDLWTLLVVGEVHLEGHSDCIKRVKVVGSTWSVL